jgi:DcmR-like sensory protein
MPDPTPSNLTDCGLPGIRNIPYGVHMCHFYRGREELAAVLVPYFAAGLRRRERCIWIAAEPLDAAAAGVALAQAGVDVDAALAGGALISA